MRPAAFLTLNIMGLLLIGGLLEAPALAAGVLILIGFALPVMLAYEVARARLDRDIAVAMAWWSVPFVVLLTCYLLDGGMVVTVGSGLVASVICHVLRVSTTPRTGIGEPDTEATEERPG